MIDLLAFERSFFPHWPPRGFFKAGIDRAGSVKREWRWVGQRKICWNYLGRRWRYMVIVNTPFPVH
jgi:hypothetical protein